MKDGKLEVGDIVYEYNTIPRNFISAYKIDRVTKTKAFCKNIMFKIEAKGSLAYHYGINRFCGFINDDEMKQKKEAQDIALRIAYF